MDCFYAAVETRDNPELRGKPIAVGGGQRRGVVTTCSYEARKFGVRSAMSGAMAQRLCPDIIFVKVSIAKYKHESDIIKGIMREITPIIEPLSLDEAYLDVTDCQLHNNSATLIAKDLKERIRKATGLTASAGVAPNKFLAKVASDWNKPDGIMVIPPEKVEEFVKDLPVHNIPGVGKVSAKKLAAHGITICSDLYQYSQEELREKFGKFGEMLYQRARGIDNRQVATSSIRKSLSVESTFMDDIKDDEQCRQELEKLLVELHRRLNKYVAPASRYSISGLFVKIKFADFVSTTKQAAGETPNLDSAFVLYKEARQRHNKPVRLLGIGVSFTDKLAPTESGASGEASGAGLTKSGTRKKPNRSAAEDSSLNLFD